MRINNGINRRIKWLRVNKCDLSQPRFLVHIGCTEYSFFYLSRVEKGSVNPSLELIVAIIKKLNINPNWLFLNSGEIHCKEFSPDELLRINSKIKELRIFLGLNRKEFCEMLQISWNSINVIEKSDSESYRKSSLYRVINNLISKFGVSPNWIFLNQGNMFINRKMVNRFLSDANLQGKIQIEEKIAQNRIKNYVTDLTTFGGRNSGLRRKLGLNKKQFSVDIYGYSNNCSHKIESGKLSPTYPYLIRLFEKTGVSPNWLLLGIGEMFDTEYQNMEKKHNICEKVRESRIRRELSRALLVEKMGFSYASIYLVENRKCVPSAKFLIAFLLATGENANWLMS